MSKLVVMVAIVVVTIQPCDVLSDGSHTDADKFVKESVVKKRRSIEQVQNDYTDKWMAIPGVEGIGNGLCEGRPCIKIYTSRRVEEIQEKIPPTVEGYPVFIEETGTFHSTE